MKAYKMREEKPARVYRVVFTPVSGYGNYSCKVYSRKEAFAKYHELKEQFINTRPGRLTVYECILDHVTNEYKEGYLCSVKTGTNVDLLAIFKNIDNELQKINDIGNAYTLDQQAEAHSKNQLNILHGIEIADFSTISDENIYKYIVNQLQLGCNLRRQAKNNLQDYKDIQDELIKIKTSLRKIESKLQDNLNYRKKSTINSKGTKKSGAELAIEVYLESIGLDPKEYSNK